MHFGQTKAQPTAMRDLVKARPQDRAQLLEGRTMVAHTSSPVSPAEPGLAERALKGAGALWFIVAVTGQWIFAYYILAAYAPPTLSGDYAQWDSVGLIQGHEPGDAAGNLMFISHVLLAAVMTVGGTLQLIPPLRRRFPLLHRMTGRVFLVVAVFLALGGLWLIWVRGTRLEDVGAMATSMDAVLILVFAAFAFHYARKRQIDRHRRWAMRLFIAASAVWYMRIFYSAWFLSVGPVGVNNTMSGWFNYVVAFGCFLVPLAVLELYLFAQRSNSAQVKAVGAGVTVVAAGLTGLGVVGATIIMWAPHF
jgi:hypothetical protein